MANPAVFFATFTETLNLNAAFGEVFISHDIDYFEGPYEYTPSSSAQTVPINGLAATADIIINPIPSNYGLIGWNGAVLTVS